MSTWILALLGGSFGAGLLAIVQAALQHHWKKQDTKADDIKALVAAQKVLMVDRVRYLGQHYIADGSITLEDKENLKEMHAAYKALGGNGHLNTVMEEVERLPISSRCGCESSHE